MSKMTIVDENGRLKVADGTIKQIESDHPIYKARIAMALPKGEWLYGPESGHELKRFETVKASPAKIEEFQKSVRLYLSPYGPDVTSRFTERGAVSMSVLVTKETLNG